MWCNKIRRFCNKHTSIVKDGGRKLEESALQRLRPSTRSISWLNNPPPADELLSVCKFGTLYKAKWQSIIYHLKNVNKILYVTDCQRLFFTNKADVVDGFCRTINSWTYVGEPLYIKKNTNICILSYNINFQLSQKNGSALKCIMSEEYIVSRATELKLFCLFNLELTLY